MSVAQEYRLEILGLESQFLDLNLKFVIVFHLRVIRLCDGLAPISDWIFCAHGVIPSIEGDPVLSMADDEECYGDVHWRANAGIFQQVLCLSLQNSTLKGMRFHLLCGTGSRLLGLAK